MAGSRTDDKGPGHYAREALVEWGKAVRYGVRAVAEKRRERSEVRPPLKERLNPSKTDKGGRLGDVADIVLSKFGTGGKLASKVSLGSRIVERLRDGSSGGSGDDGDAADRPAAAEASAANGLPANAVPIEESVDVALSVGAAYALATRFEEYPKFLDRVRAAERADDSHVTVEAKVRGRTRELEIEIIDERPKERLDWECTEGVEHSGVISFHRLAPRLTRVQLTAEFEPQGLIERLSHGVHLTGRAVRDELHRFKAYAELWEEDSDEHEPAEVEDAEEAEGPEDFEDEEDFDEEDLDDEEDLEGEEDFDDEELEEDEELEPAR